MKELNSIFKPEISPIHKVDFSIAVQLVVADAVDGGLVKAGTVLDGDFLIDPKANKATISAGAAVAPPIPPETFKGAKGVDVAAEASKVTGVLMHDVKLEAGVTDYSVGVMIEGVVYGDVMELANGAEVWTAGTRDALTALGIKTYGVKTIGIAR